MREKKVIKKTSGRLNPKKKIVSGKFLIVVAGILVAYAVIMGYSAFMSDGVIIDLSDKPTKPVKTNDVNRSGKHTSDYGTISDPPGSAWQASTLLSEINANPGKNEYQITYKDKSGPVVFGCLFDKNVIIRMTSKPGGHGTAERWSGDINFRLSSAASGGSLNDTSRGKIMGSFQTF